MKAFRFVPLLLALVASGPCVLAGAEGHPWQTPSSQQPAAEPVPPPPPAAAPLPPLPKTIAEPPPPARDPEPVKQEPPATRRVKRVTEEFDEAVPTVKVSRTTETREVPVVADSSPVLAPALTPTALVIHQPGPVSSFLGRVGNRLAMIGQPWAYVPQPAPVVASTAYVIPAAAPSYRFVTPPITQVVAPPTPQTIAPIYATPVKKCWPFH